MQHYITPYSDFWNLPSEISFYLSSFGIPINHWHFKLNLCPINPSILTMWTPLSQMLPDTCIPLLLSLSLSLIHRIKVHTTWEHSQIHSWFSFISTLASLFVCVMHCISLSAALPSEGHLSEAIHLIFNVRASGAICNLNVRGFWSLLLSIIFSCTK